MAVVAYTGMTPTPGATVTVYDAGTQVAATIYADELLTPLANPFTTDTLTGLYLFYAEQDDYDLLVAITGDPARRAPDTALYAIFNGTTPNRTASLVVDDDGLQIVLQQVTF